MTPADVLLPLLRQALPESVTVGTWKAEADTRSLPYVHLRRDGGVRHETRPKALRLPEIEMTAYADTELADAETVYDDALEALYAAVAQQLTVPGIGYLHSIKEDQGPTQVKSDIPDTWAVRGVVKLGVRPARSVMMDPAG